MTYDYPIIITISLYHCITIIILIRVHLAMNIVQNKEYAIKIMDKNKIVNENLNDNIRAEVQLMRVITHPYIVKLIEVMVANKKILLVMEYIDGGDLFDAISNTYIVNKPI